MHCAWRSIIKTVKHGLRHSYYYYYTPLAKNGGTVIFFEVTLIYLSGQSYYL
jgi:hypothetical protein